MNIEIKFDVYYFYNKITILETNIIKGRKFSNEILTMIKKL